MTVELPGPIVVSTACGVPIGVVIEHGVGSSTRQAGFLLMSTVGQPGPVSGVPCAVDDVTVAAGFPICLW